MDATVPSGVPTSVAAMMAADRASAALGIALVDSAPGRAVTRLTVGPDHVNGHDIAHGGVVFALADTAFACACNGYGEVTVAAGADIVFVRPSHLGDVLEAEAVERTRQGRTGVYDVTVRRVGESPAVVAEFRGRSATLRARPGTVGPSGGGR